MSVYFFTATSLDGFIATQDHSLEWLFKQDFDWEAPMPETAFFAGVGALVMGASTYEWLLHTQDSWEYAQPAWVMTHRELNVPEGADIRFSHGDVARIYPDLVEAAQGKDIWVMGGGDLAGQFADAGLLDEVWVQYAPVVLGAGQPLLPRSLQMELIKTARNRDFVCSRYRVLRPLE